jgi:hypothetical protein
MQNSRPTKHGCFLVILVKKIFFMAVHIKTFEKKGA